MRKLLLLLLFTLLLISSCEQSKLNFSINQKKELFASDNTNYHCKMNNLINKFFTRSTLKTSYKTSFSETFKDYICVPAYHIKGAYECGYCKLIFCNVKAGLNIVGNKIYITHRAYFSNYNANNNNIIDNNHYYYIHVMNKKDKEFLVNNILKKYLPTYVECDNYTVRIFNPNSLIIPNYDGQMFDFLESPRQEMYLREYAKKQKINLVEIEN
jgi:hypothetical protein